MKQDRAEDRPAKRPVHQVSGIRARSWLFLMGLLIATGGLLAWSVGPISARELGLRIEAPTGGVLITTHSVFLPMVLRSPPSAPPVIHSFTATPQTLYRGERSILGWGISGAVDSLILEPGFGDITGRPSVVVSPTGTTAYTLTAHNGLGSSAAQVVITVRQTPVIASLTATPQTIWRGEGTTLGWTVFNGAESLTLQPGVGDVTGQTSIVVSPTQTTTYTLVASNQEGSRTAQVKVTVRQPPLISSFTATPAIIYLGQSTILSWTISNTVESLVLVPDVGSVMGQTSAVVSPTRTKTYTLVAGNPAGSTLARAVVTVIPPPAIGSFLATPGIIDEGGSTTLSWTVSGQVESLTLEPDVGDVTGQTNVVVSPPETTTYTLSASNGAGSATAQLMVRVRPDHELLVFDWNKPATRGDHGFPGDRPPMPSANGDWTSPINFAEGTLHFRAEIRSQPVPKQMRLQFCFWQFSKGLESCGPLESVFGYPGTLATWSIAVQDMWMKDGMSIDWRSPREKIGAAIKNQAGLPVSDLNEWNWNGENPDEWYPLDMRFTTVVVAKGETFSGWDYYITP